MKWSVYLINLTIKIPIMKERIHFTQISGKLFQSFFLILLIQFGIPATNLFAQEEEEADDRPIRPPFETISLIDNQTTVNLYKGALFSCTIMMQG